MSEIYEYAGFKYEVGSDATMVPVEGQHAAADKEKHRNAARQQYLSELTRSKPVTWNTARCYSPQGQRMAAQKVEGGIVFVDIDRLIDGYIETVAGFQPEGAIAIKQIVMTAYDTNTYSSEVYIKGRHLVVDMLKNEARKVLHVGNCPCDVCKNRRQSNGVEPAPTAGRKVEPNGPQKRGAVSWNLTQEQINARLEHCANPDVHGPECVCLSYKRS